MLRVTLPLLLGIVCEGYFPFSYYFLLVVISFILLVSIATIHSRLGYHYRWILGVAFNLFIFSGGYWLAVEARQEPPYPDNYSGLFTVKVSEIPEEKERTFRLKGYLEQEIKHDSLYPVGQELLLYIKKDSGVGSIKPGDLLLAHLRLQKPTKAMNPGDFDYRNYLAVHGTYYTAFLDITESKKLPESEKFDLIILLRKVRTHLIQKLPDYGITGSNLGIFAALTLGYTGYIDTDTRNDFVASGAMHVLSVSGLHVAIVYLVFSFMLGLTNKSRRYVRVRALIVIVLLWGYALLTGLPPCVLRSTLMFCFVVGAKVFKKQSNIYNSVAVSAFIILLIDPLAVYDIGFQLSYLALLSIIYFHPKIYALLSFKSKIAQKAWELTAVSFAAQIATTPISIAIFGQFPIYFWVSNIFVIYISTILLYVAAPFAVVAFVSPFLGKLMGVGVSYLLDALRFTTDFVEQLPGAVVTGLQMNAIQAALLLLAVIMMGFYLETRKKLSIAIVAVCLSIVIFVDSVSVINHKEQQLVAVLTVRKGKAVAFINGRSATVLWSGEMNSESLARSLKSSLEYYRIKTLKLVPIGEALQESGLPFSNFFIANKSILIVPYAGKRVAIQLHKPSFFLKEQPPSKRLSVDVLYSDSPYLAKIAMNVVSPKTVVTGRNPSLRQLEAMPQVKWWSMSNSGAYLLIIR